MSQIKYRPDIDGLRAVAVLAVLFYHAKFNLFSGGYVGVDVFFVISGYLITKKIIKDIRINKFSFTTFYEGRIRRILPALLTVVVFTLIVGGWIYSATEYEELGKSAVAASISVANFFFWNQAGYFERPSILKPLLHTWSLSIEEQFYLLLPITLVLISRFFKSKFILVIAFFTGVSFLLSAYVVNHDSTSAFFFAHLRAWELLSGGLLALAQIKLKKWHQGFFSSLGLLLILSAIITYSKKTLFPGPMAFFPVIGSVLIIMSGVQGESFVSKILSTKPLVFIGKISYSLYLWHWPILVFGRYYLIRKTNVYDIIILLFVTLVISILSWKFIENPFRIKNVLVRPKIFLFMGGYITFTIVFGSVIYFSQGFPFRFSDSPQAMPPISEWDSEALRWIECFSREENNYKFPKTDETCVLGDIRAPQTFLLWGDSHAHAISSGVNVAAIRTNASGGVIGGSGCPALLGIDFSVGTPLDYCYKHNQKVIKYIERHPEFKLIILSGRWPLYITGQRYKTEEEGSVPLLDDALDPLNESASNEILFEVGLNRMLDELTRLNKEIVIVSSIPEIGYDVPSSYSIASKTGRDVEEIIALKMDDYYERNSVALRVFANFEREYKNLKVIDPSTILCDEARCKVIENNIPLYRDDDHLSTFGANYISTIFDPIFILSDIK